VGGEEGDNSVGVGGGDSGEKGGCMEGAGVKEVRGFYTVREVSNDAYRYADWSGNRDISLREFKNIRRPDLRV
jgi:hypothetical protein